MRTQRQLGSGAGADAKAGETAAATAVATGVVTSPFRLCALVIVAMALAAAVIACGAGLGLGASLALGAVVSALQATMLWLLHGHLQRQYGAVLRSVLAERVRDNAARLLSLELSHDRVRSVLESLGEGVIVVDAAGEIVLTNPAAAAALAPDVKIVEQHRLADVLVEELRDPAAKALAMLRDGGGDRPPQFRCSTIACGARIFDMTAVPVRSLRSGHDFGTVLLLVDVTRNHEVARLKDQFLSSISHELRTPLTNICAYAEILRLMLPGEDAEWPEFVRVIHEEGLHLSALVDTVFDFLLLESGEAVFHDERIAPVTILQHAVAAEQARAQAAHIQLAVEIDPDTPDVQVDSRRWAQICRNLLDNALKFTPEGGRIRIQIGRSDNRLSLRIDDSGPGVPVEHRHSVFEKFHQIPNHMTDKPAGAGLGLASCHAIVARFGGSIWCEDSPLGGAAFVVQLPVAPALIAGAVAVAAGVGS